MSDAPAERQAAAWQAQVALWRDYAHTFGSPHGARVLADIERSAFVERTTVVTGPQGLDPSATIRNEGARALALAIRAHVERGRTTSLTDPPEPPRATGSVSHEEDAA